MDSGDADLEQKFLMPNGIKLPKVGYGCWKVANDKCADCIYTAIKIGYRYFDEAAVYGNEVEAGQGIKKAIDEGICKREDLFITSKLWCPYHGKDHVKMACKKTLEDLGLDYLDLYLIHFPIAIKFVPFETKYPPGFEDPVEKKLIEEFTPVSETWGAMEEIYNEGLVKNIGVSNFNVQLMRDMLGYVKVKPANLQIEIHPYMLQTNLVNFCHKHGITVTAYSSFGVSSYTGIMDQYKGKENTSVIEDPVIKSIGEAIGKTSAQVSLRWAVQRGLSVIPKSMNEERMGQNLDILSFSLTEDQMKQINALDRNHRYNDLMEYGFDFALPLFDN